MFRVYYTNFHYFSQNEFSTIEEAFAHARKVHFESAIYKGDELVGSWGPFSGRKYY